MGHSSVCLIKWLFFFRNDGYPFESRESIFLVTGLHCYTPSCPKRTRHIPRPVVAFPPSCKVFPISPLSTSNTSFVLFLDLSVGVASTMPERIVSAGNASSYQRPPSWTVFESSLSFIRAVISVAVSMMKLKISSWTKQKRSIRNFFHSPHPR